MLEFSKDDVTVAMLANVVPELKSLLDDSVIENRLKIEALYEAAIREQAVDVEEMRREEALIIPDNIDYTSDRLNLSFEEKEKLLTIQPQTVSVFIWVL